MVVQKLLSEKRETVAEDIYTQFKRYFASFDQLLDTTHNSVQYLKQPEIAHVVISKLHELHGKFYELIAYCIMPNHVHLVIDTYLQIKDLDYKIEITPDNYKQIAVIMHLIKGATAFKINKILGRKGTFWQKESYDHCVRTPKELQNIIAYTLENPVKAGLVTEWQQWPFSYVCEQYK